MEGVGAYGGTYGRGGGRGAGGRLPGRGLEAGGRGPGAHLKGTAPALTVATMLPGNTRFTPPVPPTSP